MLSGSELVVNFWGSYDSKEGAVKYLCKDGEGSDTQRKFVGSAEIPLGDWFCFFSRALLIFSLHAGGSWVEARWGTESRDSLLVVAIGKKLTSPCWYLTLRSDGLGYCSLQGSLLFESCNEKTRFLEKHTHWSSIYKVIYEFKNHCFVLELY